MNGLPVPAASAGPEAIADWAELTALGASDRNISYEDIAEEIRRGGSTDALAPEDSEAAEEVDQRGELTEGILGSVFNEFDERAKASGPDGGYPFSVEEQVLQGPRDRTRSTYIFLLLLSHFGKDAVTLPQRPEQLFEDICAIAMASYMGGGLGSCLYKFGHPRRSGPPGFAQAVDKMCESLGEGEGVIDHSRVSQMQDAKLDLIAWRSFPDARPGKVVAYGQCSTSKDWEGHLRLKPKAFNDLWLRGAVHSPSVVFSFFPHRLPWDCWREAVQYGGVAFDRCRLAHHANRLDAALRADCSTWSRAVLGAKNP